MINLRYHIVSLTAVFLAIGIGLTLGSTFLDRATVENLNGQLENLETRLADRETQVNELQDQLGERERLQEALDEEGTGLLAGWLEEVPVVIVASRGVDESDVDAATDALVASGADVQGRWWFTERWALDDEGEVADLADAMDVTSTDPSRLRRTATDALGGELLLRQRRPVDDEAPPADAPTGDEPAGDETPGDEPAGDEPTDEPAGEPGDDADPATGAAGDPGDEAESEILTSLVAGGYIDVDAVAGAPDEASFPDGTRILFVGGSPSVPDDLVMEPLVERMAGAATTPILGVASSAMPEEDQVSDLVTVIRQDDELRDTVPTVDDLSHFQGWVATVVALADAADGVVDHYGLHEDASRLLPPLRSP